jgi:glycosyltransferase involved in cell wall biosynthesis
MRIGITLQSLDQTWGGIGVYTEEIVRALLKLDKENEYVLMYPGFGAPRKAFGQYRKHKNATELETRWSRVPSGWYWDQAIVPKVAAEQALDVLFNPFLSVPIRGRFKKVMIMHAVEYHTVPKAYEWKLYAKWFVLEKVILPAADRVISVSHVMTRDFGRFIRYPSENIRTIHHGVSERFRVIDDARILQEAKEEYELPEQFILFVGHLYPEKNFANLARALALIATSIPHDLVVVGRPRWKYESDLAIVDELGIGHRVHFLHFVPNRDLPAIYNLATCFVLPSFYEACPLVLLEAMACGCPVLAARAGAIPELADGAATLFDPHHPGEIAEAIRATVTDGEVRQSLSQRALVRAKDFSWDRCAAETLQVITEVGGGRPARR